MSYTVPADSLTSSEHYRVAVIPQVVLNVALGVSIDAIDEVASWVVDESDRAIPPVSA